MATTVISGNLSQTARELGVSLSALLAANPQLSNPNIIRSGTLLNVPGQDNLSAQESAAQLARVFSNPLVGGGSAGSVTGVPGTSFVGTAAQGFTQPTAAGTAPPLPASSAYEDRYDRMNDTSAWTLPAVITPPGTAPNVSGLFAPPPLPVQVETAEQRRIRIAREHREGTSPAITGLGRSGPTRRAVGTGVTQGAPGLTWIQQAAAAAGSGLTSQPWIGTVPRVDQPFIERALTSEEQRAAATIAAAGGPVTGGRGSQGSRGRLDTITPAWQMARELLVAANTADLSARPSYLLTSWGMEIRNLWERLVPGATTLTEFMNGMMYEQLPGSDKWVRMDPGTLSGGGGGGFSSGGGGGGGGFSFGRSEGDGALYNWHIRITV